MEGVATDGLVLSAESEVEAKAKLTRWWCKIPGPESKCE